MEDTQPDKDRKFEQFMVKLQRVAKMQPRSEYLYPIMRGVPYQDFHVSLEMALDQKPGKNDNEPD